MTRSLRAFLRITDGAMLAYWAVAAASCLGLLHLPNAVMYNGYGTPQVDAWNWSFAPLDLAFAVLGFASLRLARRGEPRWRPLVLGSLVLTMCAGGMALSYWALMGEYSVLWWLPNALLLLLPLVWLPGLIRDLAAVPAGPERKISR